jgi:hypothetical protein
MSDDHDLRHCPICKKPESDTPDTRMPRCIKVKTAAGASNTAMAQHWKIEHSKAEREGFMKGRSYGECLACCTELP